MTRTEALDLDPPTHYAGSATMRNAFGTDGEHWYECCRNEHGVEWTQRILFRLGEWTWHMVLCELDPPDTDWVPGSRFPDGPPDLPARPLPAGDVDPPKLLP